MSAFSIWLTNSWFRIACKILHHGFDHSVLNRWHVHNNNIPSRLFAPHQASQVLLHTWAFLPPIFNIFILVSYSWWKCTFQSNYTLPVDVTSTSNLLYFVRKSWCLAHSKHIISSYSAGTSSLSFRWSEWYQSSHIQHCIISPAS